MRLFSLRNGKIAAPMDLEESAGKIHAYDSTGYLVATAHYVHGTGWAIVRQRDRQIVGQPANKVEAILALRKVVGQQ